MKRSLLILIGALLLICAMFAFRAVRGQSVTVTRPTRGPAVQAVYATGTVEATVMMPLASRATARITELAVDEGAEVVKDQVLARLEASDLVAALNEARAREEYARHEFERNSTLIRSNAVAKDAFERSRSDWDAAKAALAAAEARISFLTLLAPEAGRVIKRDGEVGQLITANQPIFWLSTTAPLRVTSEVDEEDIHLVVPGQRVLIRADVFPKQTFNGVVNAITPKGDPIARSYRVRIGLTEPTPLRIGMTAETNIMASEKQNALLVPPSAVVNGRAWVVTDGVARSRPVTTGAVGTESVEVTDGVKDDDLVVVDGRAALSEGQKVHAVLAEPERR